MLNTLLKCIGLTPKDVHGKDVTFTIDVKEQGMATVARSKEMGYSNDESILRTADMRAQDIVYRPDEPSEAPGLQARIYREVRDALVEQFKHVARLQSELDELALLRVPVDVEAARTLTDDDAAGRQEET